MLQMHTVFDPALLFLTLGQPAACKPGSPAKSSNSPSHQEYFARAVPLLDSTMFCFSFGVKVWRSQRVL